MPTPIEPSRCFQRWPRRLACALAPTWTLLTTTSPTSSTIRSTRRASPSSSSRAASSGSSGMPVPRAKSLPVPSGISPSAASAEVVAPVQRGHDGVQAAVAARDDDPPGAGPVEHPVELAGVGGRGHLDRRAARASTASGPLERLLVNGAGARVGDDQVRLHGGTLAGAGAAGRGSAGHSVVVSGVASDPDVEGGPADAGHHDPRSPVGRRGQGQGDRPARDDRHDRLRGPHQRRPQRGPHDRGRRREVRDPPAARRASSPRARPRSSATVSWSRPRRCSARSTA